eukprot:TRINITY_DN8190_c0_g1_i1.p1 TRINITY_DN8190_c0_g1~~TRINITY_DN8190_c0_g1_i1.p1  ORF type:complete len:133 (+),score=18.37 TRINITY_DN8190_c0_g1_i1:430-828(+)
MPASHILKRRHIRLRDGTVSTMAGAWSKTTALRTSNCCKRSFNQIRLCCSCEGVVWFLAVVCSEMQQRACITSAARQAAQRFHVEAWVLLGASYHFGTHGIEKSDEAAVFWYKLAVEQGEVYAQLMLSNIHG